MTGSSSPSFATESTKPTPVSTETAIGLVCKARFVPLSPVGLYIPGGSAPLISTVLMLGVPAGIAGCGDIVLCTPPGPDGHIDPAVLTAASRCGIERVFRVGGAQAIAAMAYGTESIPRCVKLFGPGNAWVTEAKRQASADPEGAAQDMPAGPSEVLVIADSTADPRFREQMELLADRPEGLIEREVVVIVDTDRANPSDIRRKLRPRGFQITLIGKDGGVKLRKPFPWDVRALSRQIDKMPLRQQEIRSSSQ